MGRELFLSRFTARNFRSLGNVDITIPAEPGVVVLEGPNGLGKTTFFEAVEIALTGNVFRWADLETAQKVDVSEFAMRIGAAGGPCDVELEFSGEGSAERAKWSKDQDHQPALWLCDKVEAWGLDGARLPSFLRGTHVLSQSPHLRMLHLSAEARWDRVLSSVSGYSDIDATSKALNDVEGALTTKWREAGGAVETAKNAAENWGGRIDELRTKELALQAGGTLLTPTAARALLDASDQDCEMPADTPGGAMAELARLADLGTELRARSAKVTADFEAANELFTIPVDWSAARAALQVAAEAIVARRTDESAAGVGLNQAIEALERQTLQATDSDAALQSSRRRLTVARELLQLQAELRTATLASATARQRQSICVSELAQAKEILSSLTSQRAARGSWEERGAAIEARARELESARAALIRLQDVRTQLAACLANEQSMDGRRAAHHSALDIEEAELARLERLFAAEQEKAEAGRSEASTLKRLLAELIAHVSAGDTVCPVCHAAYPAPGELLGRATRTQSDEDAKLAQLEIAVKEARSAAETQRQRVVGAREALSAVEKSLVAMRQLRDALQQEDTELCSRVAGWPAATDSQAILGWTNALDDERSIHRAEAASELPSTTLIEHELRQKTDVLMDAEAALQSADKNARLVENEIAEKEARCSYIRQQLSADAQIPVDALEARLLREQIAAEAEFERAGTALESARRDWDAADRTAQLARQAIARAEAVLQKATSEVDALERRWIASGLELPPSSDGLAREIERLESLKRTMARRMAGTNSAVSGIQLWLQLEQLQNVRRRLDEEAGGSGPEGWDAYGATLRQAVSEKEREERRAARASRAVKAMKDEAAKRRSEMRNALTTRLEPLLKPLLRTLLVSPDVARSTLELGEFRRKTQVDAVIGKVPLVAVASEGQLAGVNLAIQLAMAQAFSWCRWRALLLDDPSQFSDVVHSASLIETLRVLARRKRFQIILSTHDRDFAKYVCRKFVNEGLTSTRIAFREPAVRDGIAPRVVESWKPHLRDEAPAG